MRIARFVGAASCAVLFSSVGLANGKTKFGNVEAITASRLYSHLQFIASDELEGRDTPSRGLNTAAKYIAAQLMLWGLKPMGDEGTYFQKVPLRRPTVSAEGTSVSIGGEDLKYGDQYYALSSAGGTAQGQVVYVGSGWQRPGVDDPYAKLDVKGKIVLAIQGRPEGVTFRDVRAGKAIAPQSAALALGAAGVILVDADPDDWDSEVKGSTEGSQLQFALNPRTPAAPTIVVKPAALAGLLSGEPMSVEDLQKRITDKKPGDPFALGSSKTVRFTVAAEENTVYTQNVVAEVEGSDRNLSKEFVAVGAHYDHLGMRPSGAGDRIYNGADDDGSGTVSILELAHAFSEGPKPKRSILFVWHCGEEKGLWGSSYFTTHPTVPIESIVAQLNIDMIGRSRAAGDTNPANKVLTGPNAIYLVGTTRMSSQLGAEAKDVNKRLYGLGYDFTYDDLNNSEQIFFRSDHFNYAMHGIPILFWFDGVHEDYHRVGDEVQKIDFQKMEKVARTVYATAWEVANRKDRPKVDMPLPDNLRRG